MYIFLCVEKHETGDLTVLYRQQNFGKCSIMQYYPLLLKRFEPLLSLSSCVARLLYSLGYIQIDREVTGTVRCIISLQSSRSISWAKIMKDSIICTPDLLPTATTPATTSQIPSLPNTSIPSDSLLSLLFC